MMLNTNDTLAPGRPLEWINPALDFTQDTAYVGVKIFPEQGRITTGQAVVVTSQGQVIPWTEASLLENGLLPETGCPALLEARWSRSSVQAFQDGAESATTHEVFQSVRGYLQKYLGLRHQAEYDLVALWIMGTYLKPLFKCYPLLFFNAPYESGKSRCLEVISQLALNGKWFGEITAASLRRYAENHPTFCLDELKEVSSKSDSPLISILLNTYNSAEVAFTEPVRGRGWQPVIFKAASPVAIGNIQEIKNTALQSRTIQIRTEYDPRFKNSNLPLMYQREPAQIRDGLYLWFLRNWRQVRDCFESYPEIPELGARETDSYKPLLAIASLVGPETVGSLTGYAAAVRKEKNNFKKAIDDSLDLLLFIRDELELRGLGDELPVISNRDLADAYGRKNHLRVNYRRFLGMVNSLHVVSDIRDRHGSKYFILNRPEIDRQLQLAEAKS